MTDDQLQQQTLSFKDVPSALLLIHRELAKISAALTELVHIQKRSSGYYGKA